MDFVITVTMDLISLDAIILLAGMMFNLSIIMSKVLKLMGMLIQLLSRIVS